MTELDFAIRLPDPILTSRLVLRAPRLDDASALAALANNIKVHKMLSRLPHPYGEDDAVAFITGMARSATNHAYAIVTRDGVFVGVVGLHKYEPEDPVEIGYWLGEPFWGLGYASEAASALVAATEATGGPPLIARAQSINGASIRVLEKSGFRRTDERTADCGPHKGVAITFFEREMGR